jgi:hypothetical protein
MQGGIGARGEQSTDAQILALTNLAALPTDLTKMIVKSGPTTFSQVDPGASSSGITINTTTITGGTTGLLLYDNAGTVGELTLTTYPSLTELSYVKGVTSAIQTQINSKVTGSGTSSGTNTGDQTITLTGAVTGSGTGSFATTLATPGTLTVASTNSNVTAHTHAITSSSAPGAAASLLATDGSGIIGSTGTRIVKIWAVDLTVTNAIAGSITGNAGTVTGATFTTALTVNTGTVTLTGNAANTSVLTIGAGAVSVSGSNTGDQTTVSGNAGTATALQTARALWGQNFDGTAAITGSLTSVGDITGGASSMTITAGTGNSRTLIFKTTTSGGSATTALTLGADQSATFAGHLVVEGVTSTGATGTGKFVFDGSPTVTSPTINTLPVFGDGALVKYTLPTVDGTATGEMTNQFNAGYTTVLGDLVYLDSSATWQKCDANASATYKGLLGIVLTGSITSGNPVNVLLNGWAYMATAFPTFTVGAEVYMSETAGAVTATAPTTTDATTRIIGFAFHADKIRFCPANNNAIHT